MKKIFYTCCLLLLAISICACFSSFAGDTGNLTISFGNSGNARAFVQPGDLPNFTYVVLLNGPGGTITKSFTYGSTATFTVVPGTWTVTVKGHNAGILRVMGIEQFMIKPGNNGTKTVHIYTATEVSSWNDLNVAITLNNTELNAGTRTEMIVIKNDFPFGTGVWDGTISILRPVIIIAETDVTVTRFPGTRGLASHFFNVIGKGHLTLGYPNMAGSLIFDGTFASSSTAPIIQVAGDDATSIATLTINKGVTIRNNTVSNNGDTITSGGGVIVSHYGNFIMNGGTITGNTANGDVGGPGIGGGVYVIGEYDETAVGGGITPGGKFTMNGGTISSNTAENNGGGVYVGRHANYIKNGGSITGNIPDNVYREP